jgi:hypothetical protein
VTDEPTEALPSLVDYTAAIQFPDLCFPDDPELRTATPLENSLGTPRSASGNFGGVYCLESADRRHTWGVKCFHRAAGVRPARYRAVCDRLRALDPDREYWYVPVDFREDGILVSGRRWPLVKMTWINSRDLMAWLNDQFTDPAAASPDLPEELRGLAAHLTDVVLRLEELGIAHGDLQHGNILVSSGRRVRLVDYDAMYVPALSGQARPEAGHRHYQHPAGAGYFGPGMDRFPARVIQASLLALAADPGLWTRLRTPGDERLLLGEADFADPDASEAFAAFDALGDPALDRVVARLRRDLRRAPGELEPLTRLRERDTPKGAERRAERVRWPVPEPTPEPEPTPVPEPTPEPAPEPKPVPEFAFTFDPFADPGPAPVAEPEPESPAPSRTPSYARPSFARRPEEVPAYTRRDRDDSPDDDPAYDPPAWNATPGLSVLIGLVVLVVLLIALVVGLTAAHVPLRDAWCHVPHACAAHPKS